MNLGAPDHCGSWIEGVLALSVMKVTLSYARSAIDGDEAQSATTFLFRRAVRILPLYWVVVCVALLFDVPA